MCCCNNRHTFFLHCYCFARRTGRPRGILKTATVLYGGVACLPVRTIELFSQAYPNPIYTRP